MKVNESSPPSASVSDSTALVGFLSIRSLVKRGLFVRADIQDQDIDISIYRFCMYIEDRSWFLTPGVAEEGDFLLKPHPQIYE